MINNGYTPSYNGRKITSNSSEESKWLSLILNSLKGGCCFNTIQQYNIVGGTQTFLADTIHSISFSVITGSVTVSMDGGNSSITYPSGSNVNLEASGKFNSDIIFTWVSGQTILQTLS